MSKQTLHVQFSTDLSTYGDASGLEEWKAAADRLMVEYLRCLGYEVVEEDDSESSTCWLEDGDLDEPRRLLSDAWEDACAKGTPEHALRHPHARSARLDQR